MYNAEPVRKVAHETRPSQRVVSDVLDATLGQIGAALATKKRGVVALPGFGTFYTRTKAAAEVRSIATGKPVEVPAHRVAGFRVGEVLRRAVWKAK